MDALNYEIDLKFTDQKRKRKKLQPSLFIAAVFLSVLFLVTCLYFSLEYFYRYTDNRVTHLQKELEMLNNNIEPILLLSENIDEARRKEGIITKLKPAGETFSHLFLQVLTLAPGEIEITSININGSGDILITGLCTNMQTVAVYQQSLDQSASFSKSELTDIHIVEEKCYSFKITLLINSGDKNYDL